MAMKPERDILAALDQQIKNDEIIELRELAAVTTLFRISPNRGIVDYLHSLVKSSVNSPSVEMMLGLLEPLKNNVDKMILLIEEAKKTADDLEARAKTIANRVVSKNLILRPEARASINEVKSAGSIRKRFDRLKTALENLNKALQDALVRQQMNAYFNAESLAHEVIREVTAIRLNFREIIYCERILERLEGLP